MLHSGKIRKILNKKCLNLDKALLVGVILPNNYQTDIENYLSELSLLAKTAQVEVLGKITQNLSKINPAFYIGKGKANQVIEQAKILDANLIIFDEELSPAQIKNYHKLSKNINSIRKFVNSLKLFGYGYSWGGFESLVLHQEFRETGNRKYMNLAKDEHLVRFHIGLEDPKDLIADIKQSLRHLK